MATIDKKEPGVIQLLKEKTGGRESMLGSEVAVEVQGLHADGPECLPGSLVILQVRE